MRAYCLLLVVTLVPQFSLAEDKSQPADQLNQIRNAVGPEVSPQLRASEAEFANALNQINNTGAGSQNPIQPNRIQDSLPAPRRRFPSPSHNGWLNVTSNQSFNQPFPPNGWGQASPMQPDQRLKLAAHQLDQIAHELEMANLFQAADNIRESAKALRLRARNLITGTKGSERSH